MGVADVWFATLAAAFLSGFLPFVNIEAYLVGAAALLPGAPPLVFTSALTGLPPFYVVSVAAGTLGFRPGPFLLAGFAGRLLRFGAVFALPGLLAWVIS